MRIIAVRATTINVPFSVPFGSSFAAPRTGTTRVVVEVETDAGIIGLGETMRGRLVRELVEALSPGLIGKDPFELESLLKQWKMTPFFYGYVGYAAIGALEMACWDLMGRALDVPLYKLLGGRFRQDIPITGLLTDKPGGQGTKAQRVVEISEDIRNQFGFSTLKLKGSTHWREDIEILQALVEAHSSEVRLRIDPNWAWSVQDALQVAKAVEDLPLEWLEDPTEGIEGMARLRRDTKHLLATNMCVVSVEDIAPAMRMNAVDVILGDPHKWGGILPTKKLAAVCEALQLGMSLHSGGEVGISTAANLHIVASTPVITYAVDSLYYLLKDDVITNPFEIQDGVLQVPEAPGLGVELDRAKLDRYAALNRAEGDYVL